MCHIEIINGNTVEEGIIAHRAGVGIIVSKKVSDLQELAPSYLAQILMQTAIVEQKEGNNNVETVNVSKKRPEHEAKIFTTRKELLRSLNFEELQVLQGW